MIDVSPGLFVSSLPWWVAAPLLQLAVLVVGMALDETYVNRTTVLTGAIAAHMHIFVAGDVGLLVALYADIGLVLGAYGLYAYVIDGYVANWFRLVAYFVYSPLSVFLVILTAGPTLFGIEPLVIPALVGAGYANYQLREYLAPREPYYFGPESQLEFESILEAEAPADAPAGVAAETDGADATETAGATHASETGTTHAPGDSSVGSGSAGIGGGAAASAGVATADGGTTTDAAGTMPSETASAPAETGESAPTETAAPSAGGERTTVEQSAPEPAPEPAAAADSSERGILPKFMRRL